MVNKSNVQTKKLDIAKNGLLYGQVPRNVQIWSALWSDITLSKNNNIFGQRYVPFVTTQWEHRLNPLRSAIALRRLRDRPLRS